MSLFNLFKDKNHVTVKLKLTNEDATSLMRLRSLYSFNLGEEVDDSYTIGSIIRKEEKTVDEEFAKQKRALFSSSIPVETIREESPSFNVPAQSQKPEPKFPETDIFENTSELNFNTDTFRKTAQSSAEDELDEDSEFEEYFPPIDDSYRRTTAIRDSKTVEPEEVSEFFKKK